MKESKILFKNKYFNVIQTGETVGIEPLQLDVAILAFVRDEKGLPNFLGVLREFNPLRDGQFTTTVVTGKSEEEDPDILSTAIREFKEESGYDVPDLDRWFYLGQLTGSKIVKQEHPCFAVDITGLEKKESEGEESESEENSKFKLMSIKEALNSDDCYVLSLFMKIFLYIFGFQTSEEPEGKVMNFDEESNEVSKANEIKKLCDEKYLKIEGVNGSLLVKDENTDEEYIEYTVNKMTDEIKEIPSASEGIKIKIKLIDEKSEK